MSKEATHCPCGKLLIRCLYCLISRQKSCKALDSEFMKTVPEWFLDAIIAANDEAESRAD